MGTKLLVETGSFPVLWSLGGEPALVRRAWPCPVPGALEAVNDNAVDHDLQDAQGTPDAQGAQGAYAVRAGESE